MAGNGRGHFQMDDLEIERRFNELESRIDGTDGSIQTLNTTQVFMVTRVKRVEAIFWRLFWAVITTMGGAISFLLTALYTS